MPYVNYHQLNSNAKHLTPLPEQMRCVVIGGGIHGLGIAHDLSSRGVDDVWLLEKNTFGSGTSSWSTKLIHGGLRYLENIADWRLVRSSLAERRLLMKLAPDLIYPLPLLYPVYAGGARPAYQVKVGLWLYDRLAQSAGLRHHEVVSAAELTANIADFRLNNMTRCFQFWDAMTDDLALSLRVAASAHTQGAHLCEGIKVEHIESLGGRYQLNLSVAGQSEGLKVESAAVVLATGPWAHELLTGEELTPKHQAVNNKGVHLVLEDLGLTKGLLLEAKRPVDGRIIFALPWQGYTLIGTTEKAYSSSPDQQRPEADELDYLLANFAYYSSMSVAELEAKIKYVYSGLRWLVQEPARGLSKLSREYQVSTHGSQLAKIWTLYGGKLTGYRLLAKEVADQVSHHLSHDHSSVTHQRKYWASHHDAVKPLPELSHRFMAYELFKQHML